MTGAHTVQLVEPGSVIQLHVTPDNWGPLLCIVDTVYGDGVQCYAMVPEQRGEPPSHAYFNVKHGDYTVIGTAEYISVGRAAPEPNGEDPGDSGGPEAA